MARIFELANTDTAIRYRYDESKRTHMVGEQEDGTREAIPKFVH